MLTHEAFINTIAHNAINLALGQGRITDEQAASLLDTKLVYGAGQSGLRGVTFFNRWQRDQPAPFVEVCAMGEESPTQLAGTTIHELGHVLAGPQAGHRKDWRLACQALGLRLARATGHQYLMAGFDPALRMAINALGTPQDGSPASLATLLPGVKFKPCTAGVGTMGGKSRGAGSGSRLRLYQCSCEPPVKARVASDCFDATCNQCNHNFALQVKP